MLDLGKKWEILQELLPTQVIADLADSISCLDSVPIQRPNPSLSAIVNKIRGGVPRLGKKREMHARMAGMSTSICSAAMF